jgi:predicted permease
MAQTVLQQVLILAAMMMLGFLLGKLGKVERKGADLLSMLLLDVFFPCNILAAASGDFGDMPFSQVIKIALAYMSCFCLHFWPSQSQNCSG